ncbi:MAG: hypothetical protein CL911_06240, partial [Deltaproteobacteria bacterium]|nr:hypothetical protein [Deltaproteobacteria bacterium]
SFSCGEFHHPSGLQGKRFVRCRIGFDYTCCKEGCEDNLEKLQKAGFLHMQTQGGTCLPSGTSPHADADAGSFREFRIALKALGRNLALQCMERLHVRAPLCPLCGRPLHLLDDIKKHTES